MDGLTPEIAMFLLAAGFAGIILGWLVRGRGATSGINKLADVWQAKLDDVVREGDQFSAQISSLQATLDTKHTVVQQHETELARLRTALASAQEKTKSLHKDVLTLRAEREDTKVKVSTIQEALVSIRRQTAELQSEFIKAGDFYKGELAKSFGKRKALELKVEHARQEQESFANLLNSSRSEQDSVNNMLASAQSRLAHLDELEQNIISLEADNAQLHHDTTLAKQETEALQRDVTEIEELRSDNKELTCRLGSMESSRKQYESDAKRYRDHAGESEQKSETLRLKLDEVEKHFAAIEIQQKDAIKDVREAKVVPISSAPPPNAEDMDELQHIVGIGKAFELTLHELGIYTFQQIAGFDLSDIARVNAELKEFRGRMEQDDWIGQAKDLHFKKYGKTA